MGKQKARAAKADIVADFLEKLVADPEALGKFIKDPEGELNKAGILPKYGKEIKTRLGWGIAKKLIRVKAFYVNS